MRENWITLRSIAAAFEPQYPSIAAEIVRAAELGAKAADWEAVARRIVEEV